MAFQITNTTALSAHGNLATSYNSLAKSVERLSSGLRINRAADDPAGLHIASGLDAQAKSFGQAIRNSNDGTSIMQIMDDALYESVNILSSIKTKAVQAAQDSQSTATRKTIQNDITKLLEELNIIAQTSTYNGQNLLTGIFSDKKFQIGAGPIAAGTTLSADTVTTADTTMTNDMLLLNGSIIKSGSTMTAGAYAGENLTLNAAMTTSQNMTLLASGSVLAANAGGAASTQLTSETTLRLSDLSVLTAGDAQTAIVLAEAAMDDINAIRATVGATQSQFAANVANLSTAQVNAQNAYSNIMDIDFSEETIIFTKMNVLMQPGSFALTQANAMTTGVLNLLQGGSGSN